MKKKIILPAVLLLAVLFVMVFCVYAESVVRLDVNITSDESVSVYVDGKYKAEAPFSANVPKNAEIKLVGSSDCFLFFTNDDGNTVSENNEYSFTASSKTSVTAWYSNSNTNKVQVIYRNSNTTKQMLNASLYSKSMIESTFKSHLIASASKFGYEFVSWDKSVEEIVSEGKANGIVIVTPVYKASESVVTVNVVGGSITSENLNNDRFTLNSVIKLTADVPENGKKFAYWTNSNGVIISDAPEFTLSVSGNETYTAHFADENETVSLSPITGLSYYYDKSIDRIVSVSTVFVPAGYDLVSYGLIYAK